MVIYFIIIKHKISYEFITFTHTLMFGQLHTSSIDIRLTCTLYTLNTE